MRRGRTRYALAVIITLAALLAAPLLRAQPAPDAVEPASPSATVEAPSLPDPSTSGDDPGDTSVDNPVVAPRAPRPARRAGGHAFTRADDAAERTRMRARTRPRRVPGAPEVLEVNGAPDAFFYRPLGRRQRVFVYLHARGASPEASCRQLRAAVTPYGWLLCPVGPVDRGEGRREWNNNPIVAHTYAMASFAALHGRFAGRVMTTGHVVMGFSEGAFVAMQLGLIEPRIFPRWIIFAGSAAYLSGEHAQWDLVRRWTRRVYLFTGARDNVLPHTRRAEATLRRERVGRVLLREMPEMGHALPDNPVTLGRAIRWVLQ